MISRHSIGESTSRICCEVEGVPAKISVRDCAAGFLAFARNDSLSSTAVSDAVEEAIVPEQPVSPVVAGGLRGFIAKFTVLRGAQRELWLTFLIKFFIYTAYSVTNKRMVLWLSHDPGVSDQASGAFVGWFWAPEMTVFKLLSASITDPIG